MLFVCLIKVFDSLGLMGVETGNDNLGGLAGTTALVTVMDGITSFPLASPPLSIFGKTAQHVSCLPLDPTVA